MNDLTPRFLPILDSNQATDLPFPVFRPFYSGLSIANLPSSICAWLGVDPPEGMALPLREDLWNAFGQRFRTVILLLVDGFGLDLFLQAVDAPAPGGWRNLPSDALLAPLTSVVPSTTATALTTLWTGVLPAEHGVIGYELFLKEYSLIANMIFHNPASFSEGPGNLRLAGFDPATFLPVEPLAYHLGRAGVQTYAFIQRALARSSLSLQLHREARTSPFLNLADLFVSLDALLDAPAREKRYIYAYWPGLDDTMHQFGPGDERVQRELAAFGLQWGYFLADRLRKRRGDTLILLTADHGHIFTPKNPHFELRHHSAFLEMLAMLPSGEARLPYVFVRHGRAEDFQEYMDKVWGDRFRPVPAERFLKAGLFGAEKQHPRLTDRVGDFVVLPDEGAFWYFANRENPLLGRHGGLSRAEMLVPLLGLVL